MPRYLFICPQCDAKDEAFCSIAEMKMLTVQCGSCGETMERDVAAEVSNLPVMPGNWPMECDAAGVGINQIQAASEHSIRHGVPTGFNSETGAAKLRNPKHYKEYCELVGLYARNGGYSCPQKRNSIREEQNDY